MLSGFVLVIVTAASVVVALVARPSSSVPSRGAIRLLTLELVVPPHWHVRRLEYDCGRASAGVLVGNLAQNRLDRLRHDLSGLPPHSCTTIWDVSTMPPGYVLADVTQLTTPSPLPQSVFPLNYKEFAPGVIPCHCSFRDGFVVSGGLSYNVRIWTGNAASAEDRQRLQQVIASIRPPNQ